MDWTEIKLLAYLRQESKTMKANYVVIWADKVVSKYSAEFIVPDKILKAMWEWMLRKASEIAGFA